MPELTAQPDEMERVYDRLQTLAWGFAPPAILSAAANSGLLCYLAEREPGDPASPEEAAAALGLHPVVTAKVLRALTGMDLLTVSKGRYALISGARPLFEPGSELDHTPALRHIDDLARRWGEGLTGFLRTGDWARPPRTPEGTLAFVEAMRALALGMAGRLDAALPLQEVKELLDIGGALGTFSIELCLRHPALRATVLDLPAVVPLAEAEVARHGLEDRIQVLPGSYLDPACVLPRSDLVLLANVLHQESAADAAAMIGRAAGALRPGGRLAVLEFTVEEDRCHPLSGAVFALNMRLFGDTYSDRELTTWMTSAGLCEVMRQDLSPSKFLVSGRRPQATGTPRS